MTRQEEACIQFEKWFKSVPQFSKYLDDEVFGKKDNQYTNDIVQGLFCAYYAGYFEGIE